MVNADFFYFWDRPWYSDEEQPGFCLIYILNKDKEFQSCALLEIPSSPPFMNEFHQWQKHTKNMQVSTWQLQTQQKQ